MRNRSYKSIFPIVIFILLIITWAISKNIRKITETKIIRHIQEIPYEIEQYHGTEIDLSEPYEKELNTDDYLFRKYINKKHYDAPQYSEDNKENRDWFWVYIGYWGTEKGGRTGHNPYDCYPASGWTIINKMHIKIDVGSKLEKVNMIRIRKGNNERIVAFWYQGKEKILRSGLRQNMQRFINRILYRKDEGAFVRISTDIYKTETKQRIEEIRHFSGKIYNLLKTHWPDEVITQYLS